MKTKTFLISSLALVMVLPVITLATTTPQQTNICTKVITRLENQNKKLADQLSQFETRKDAQLKKLSENRLTADERRLDVRNKVDERRDTRFTKLEARATTTEQKVAIATFRSTLSSITEARRLAVDTAVKTYRDSVDQILAKRKLDVETARKSLQAAIDALLLKAKADCSANVSAQTVRQDVNNGIKAARAQFVATVKGLDKTSDVVKSATETRKTAVAKAQADFKAAYDKAIADLKAAFQK